MSSVDVESTLDVVGGLDGLHHLWCEMCHPDWVLANALGGVGLGRGVPFDAWCGVRAVILTRWLTDDVPPGVCPVCSDPDVPCAACGFPGRKTAPQGGLT